jgi:hypothetical protein
LAEPKDGQWAACSVEPTVAKLESSLAEKLAAWMVVWKVSRWAALMAVQRADQTV